MAGLVVVLSLCLLSFSIFVLAVFYLYVKGVFNYFKKRGIPYEKPKFPFGNLSTAFQCTRSISFTLADMHDKFKDHKMVGFFNLWRKQVLIRDPEIIKHILIKDFEIFQDRGVYYNKQKDPLSAHLFALDGDAWKLLRAKLSPTFTSGKVKGMYPIILDSAKLLIDYLENHCPTKTNVECQSMFTKYALTVISATAFGIENNCLTEKKSTFTEMIGKMNEPTAMRIWTMLLMLNGHTADSLNIRVVPKLLTEYFLGLVKDTIKFRERSGIKRNDYLQQLIDLRNSVPKGAHFTLTEEELIAQAFVFILAGSETTSTTMSFCLYELSRNPEIQERLHQEVDALSDISYDSVQNCQYLEMVISETLRKYPSLGFLIRECSRDYKVPGTHFVIEKGTQVWVSLQGMQNDPDLFSDPEVFDPERFSKENKDNIKAYTYMPFGDGKRYCIGLRFGLIVLKTGLATLLRRYEVCSVETPDSSLRIDPRTFVTTVEGGLWLGFKERSLT